MKEHTRKCIINTLQAAGANILTDTNFHYIVDDNTSATPTHYSPPLQIGSIKSVTSLASQAEVVGIQTCGKAEETILAGERYGISIDQIGLRAETGYKPPFKYAYTAPNPLSGNADTDRATVYNALVSKINAYAGNNVIAYACYRIAFTLGSDQATGVIGSSTVSPLAAITTTNKIRGGTSGAQETSAVTANIAAIEITSGTIEGDDAVGNIWIYNVSDIASWDAGVKYIEFTDGTEKLRVTTNAAPTAGQALVIVDDAGYYPARPNNNLRGPSAVQLYAGFTTSEVEELRTGLVSRGIGSRLDDDNPVFTPDGSDVISGTIENANPYGDGAFNSAKTYTTFIMQWEPDANYDGLTNAIDKGPQQFIIYADESNSGNLTAFGNALIALT